MANVRRKKVNVPTEKELVKLLKLVAEHDPEAKDSSYLDVDLEVDSKTGKWTLRSGSDAKEPYSNDRYLTQLSAGPYMSQGPRLQQVLMQADRKPVYHARDDVSAYWLGRENGEEKFKNIAEVMLEEIERWAENSGLKVERKLATTKTRATKSGGR